MASTVKHLRSSTASKRPTASGLSDGQLGINTASGTPGVFFKDSGGVVVKVGPAHVGSAAPNATPAGSAGNSLGELWVNNSTTINGLNYFTGSAFVNLTPSGTATVAGLVELATDAETQTGTDTVRAVTPSGLQSKVSNSISTISSTTIASATAVKTAYDLANAALPKSGGRVTGALEIGPVGSLVFEGSTDDGFETTIAVVNPTADRTVTFPNVTGTVVTTGDTGSVTSTMILDGTIVNADVNASAAIDLSKLATGALPSGITVNSANIADGAITNADINASAAIVDTKLATIATAGKVSGTAITSGNIVTSGSFTTTGSILVDAAAPTIRLEESDGTATHNRTLLIRDGSAFSIRTRSSADASVSSDYIIDTNASGATIHRWNIANAEELRLNSTGLGVGTANPTHRLEVARLGTDQIITGVDANTAVLVTAGGGTSTSGAAITVAGGTDSACSIFLGDTAAGNIGGITYDNTSDSLLLRANGTTRATVTSTGQLRLAGAGITFNGDTAEVNELDDYEEGTFTPVIEGTTTAGTGTYTTQSGRYVKIGKNVTITIMLAITAHTGTGNLQITGLPFASLNVSPMFQTFAAYHTTLTLAANSVLAPLLSGGNTATILLQQVVTGGGTAVSVAMDTAFTLRVTGSYISN